MLWKIISQFLVLRPRISVIPHKKIHYFENLHYLGKFLRFKEKQAKDTTGFTF